MARGRRVALPSLSREDVARWQMGSRENPMEITAVVRLAGEISLAEVRALAATRLRAFPRLRARVVPHFSGLHWVEEADFEVARHVQAATTAPSERALAELVSRLASERLDDRRPLWGLHVVDGMPGSTTLVARFHHVVADGLALLQVLQALCDEGAAGERLLPPPVSVAEERRSELEGARRLARLITSRPDPSTVLRRPPSVHKRVAWSAALPLDDLRGIARRHGVRTHEVVLSLCTGAVHRAMGAVDPSLVVRAMVPISLRRRDDRDLGNHFASVFLPLPLGLRDPQARLATIAGATRDARAHFGKGTGVRLLGLVGGIGARLERAAVQWLSARASLVVSNLPGPTEPLHLGGHRVQALVGFAPVTASLSFGVTVVGHAGELRAGVVVGSADGLDPWSVTAAVDVELEALLAGGSGR